MIVRIAPCLLVLCSLFALAQEKTAAVTVPMTVDHNRIVIDIGLPLPNGTIQPFRAWVNNGNPELGLSRHAASLLGLQVSCDDMKCSSSPPPQILIGGMLIPLTDVKQTEIPLKPVSAAAVLAPGMKVEVSIPSRVLRHYDVLVDYPGKKFTIGPPGSIHFRGSSSKVQVNPEDGLIEVPTQIENKKYILALDLGASIGFLGGELFAKLADTHPDWPHMTGAVGPVNMWGSSDETLCKVMRVDRVQFGPLFLTNVALLDSPKDRTHLFSQQVEPTSGILGANVMQNYRVGLDYAHSTVYFDIGRLFNFPEFDVIGLTLRPEDDGHYSVIGVANIDGKPSVPWGPVGIQAGDHLVAVGDITVRGSTLGQVWAMLGGSPGQERKLTMERDGKQFVASATVQHFLAIAEDDEPGKKKSKKR